MMTELSRRWYRLRAAVAEAREPNDEWLTPEQVAMHEAAHIVVALAYGVPMKIAVLAPSGRSGYVSHEARPFSPDEEREVFGAPTFTPADVQDLRGALRKVTGGFLEELIVTAAGPAMNVRMGVSACLAAHDLANIERCLAALTGRPAYIPMRGYDPETKRLWAWLDQQADYVIGLNEKWICRTAQALMAKRVLTSAEVKALKPNPGVMRWR